MAVAAALGFGAVAVVAVGGYFIYDNWRRQKRARDAALRKEAGELLFDFLDRAPWYQVWEAMGGKILNEERLAVQVRRALLALPNRRDAPEIVHQLAGSSARGLGAALNELVQAVLNEDLDAIETLAFHGKRFSQLSELDFRERVHIGLQASDLTYDQVEAAMALITADPLAFLAARAHFESTEARHNRDPISIEEFLKSIARWFRRPYLRRQNERMSQEVHERLTACVRYLKIDIENGISMEDLGEALVQLAHKTTFDSTLTPHLEKGEFDTDILASLPAATEAANLVAKWPALIEGVIEAIVNHELNAAGGARIVRGSEGESKTVYEMPNYYVDHLLTLQDMITRRRVSEWLKGLMSTGRTPLPGVANAIGALLFELCMEGRIAPPPQTSTSLTSAQ